MRRRLASGLVFLALATSALGALASGRMAPPALRDATAGRSQSAAVAAAAAAVRLPSSQQSAVTVYGATWCGACKVLERGLRERDIPFDVIDVDRNPDAHARARAATGTSAIPVTNVVRSGDGVWIVGADVPAVERAYRGN